MKKKWCYMLQCIRCHSCIQHNMAKMQAGRVLLQSMHIAPKRRKGSEQWGVENERGVDTMGIERLHYMLHATRSTGNALTVLSECAVR
jgi:hypothetical protein